MKTTLAITLGDINGIGPEIALKATLAKRWPTGMRFVLVGSHPVLDQQARNLGFPTPPLWNPEQGRPNRKVVVWDHGTPRGLRWQPGKVSAPAGRAAAAWAEAAAKGCRDGIFGGMVTAPLSKEGLHRAGITAPGHTEMLAAWMRTKRYAMMLMGGPLRVVIATRHIPLSEVPKELTRKVVTESIVITGEALSWLGCRKKRLAVCGLNPHAGEGGDLGHEEKTIISPAMKAAARRGVKSSGPHPGDTVFFQAAHGDYDAVVAMYHDQGLGPLKTLAFDQGVNLTLGLPIVRTSPDHGTAYNLAGRGVARVDSMVEATRTAAKLAGKRNPWRS